MNCVRNLRGITLSDCCSVPEGDEADLGTAEENNMVGVHDCCAPEPQSTEVEKSSAREPLCPTNGAKGHEVPMTAVASLVRWEVEAARLVDPKYFLCPDPSCETVYYGSGGAVIGKSELRVRVGFKESEGPITWCYCFDVTEEKIRQEILNTGECASKDHIVAEVKKGRCACHVKNPTGGCCLGDITKAIKQAKALNTSGAIT